MRRRSLVVAVSALALAACSRVPSAERAPSHALLVPDWENNVVHRIALDGSYEGDFLGTDRHTNPAIDRGLWTKPYVALFLDESPPRVWVLADKASGAWDASGHLEATIVADTQILETPTCAVRVGERVIAVSPDMKEAVVFALDGRVVARFGYPTLSQANDCKIGPDGLLYVASRLTDGHPGLISVWDPALTSKEAAPLKYLVPGDARGDETYWAHSLAFDDNGDILLTELSRGRLERWDVEQNRRLEILLDSDRAGAYLKLERGPDGLIYLAGPEGIYRFRAQATATEISELAPFFDSETIKARYGRPFSPTGLTFAPLDALSARH